MKLYDLLPEIYKDRETEKFFEVLQVAIDNLESDIAKIPDLIDIDELPEELLNLWALTLCVKGYEFANTIEEKRHLVKSAIELFKLKGTPAGIKKAAEIAGSKVLRLIEPPSKFFLSSGLSKEEKNKWLRQFPQLRIHPNRERGNKQGMLFWKDYLSANAYALQTDAMFRMTARATLYDPVMNREEELITTFWQTERISKQAVIDVHIPGKAGFASFLGTAIPFTAKTDASTRVIYIKEPQVYIEEKRKLCIQTVTRSFKTIYADAEYVSEASTQRSMFCNSAKSFFVNQTDAVDRIFYRFYLFDASKPVAKNLSPNHLGVTRLGMPHHTCELTLDLTRKRRKVFRYVKDAVFATDKSRIYKVFNAVQDYNRASVKILADTMKFRPLKANYIITADQNLIAGQYKEVA